MVYLIYGHQLPVIKKTLKNLIKSCLNGEEADDFNCQKFSARLIPVQDIVFDAMSLPLGSDRKVVVVTDPYFLSSDKEKVSLEKEQDYEALIGYLKNPSPHTDLIFFLEAKDLNTKSEIYKALKSSGKIIPQDPLTEPMLKSMGNAIFTRKGSVISQEALDELVTRCGEDVSKFVSEATKLSLYKNDIGIDDVRLMVANRPEDNAFQIAESLIQNQIARALKTYYDLRLNKEEPVRLIALLATQFRFMLEVQYLIAKNLSFEAIASALKCNPYRVNRTARSLVLLKRKHLLNILDALYHLDADIKSGERDPYFSFEMFLINFNSIKSGQ